MIGYALAEDGTLLASHFSSDPDYSKKDMRSPFKREAYRKHYPAGYTLEWIEDPRNDKCWREAMERKNGHKVH